jgi:hypothetical protein
MFNWFKKKAIPDTGEVINPGFLIRYQYVWKDEVPLEERDTEGFESREFCKYLVNAGKFYTRSDIETMSQKLGYSVWNRCGGDGCRHKWESVVVKKNK